MGCTLRLHLPQYRTPPDEWEPPFDLRGVKSWDEAVRLTGRTYDNLQFSPEWLSERQVFDKQVCGFISMISVDMRSWTPI